MIIPEIIVTNLFYAFIILKSDIFYCIDSVFFKFKINAVIMHLNRGCEGAGLGQMETREELIKAGIPVMTYEGNMGDTRDFDAERTMSRVRAFLEAQGLTKLTD